MTRLFVPSVGFVALAAVVGLAWAYETGLGSSRARVERQHGVEIPASAENIRCKGDAWGGFFDQGAVTLFNLPADDLDAFVSQLEQHATAAPGEADNLDGNQLMTLTGGRPLLENRVYGSSTGSRMAVRVWRIDSNMLAVNLHTDWD